MAGIDLVPRGGGGTRTVVGGGGDLGALLEQASDGAKGLWMEVEGADAGWHMAVTEGSPETPAVPAVPEVTARQAYVDLPAADGAAGLRLTLPVSLPDAAESEGNDWNLDVTNLPVPQASQGATATLGDLLITRNLATGDDSNTEGNDWWVVAREHMGDDRYLLIPGTLGTLILRLDHTGGTNRLSSSSFRIQMSAALEDASIPTVFLYTLNGDAQSTSMGIQLAQSETLPASGTLTASDSDAAVYNFTIFGILKTGTAATTMGELGLPVLGARPGVVSNGQATPDGDGYADGVAWHSATNYAFPNEDASQLVVIAQSSQTVGAMLGAFAATGFGGTVRPGGSAGNTMQSSLPSDTQFSGGQDGVPRGSVAFSLSGTTVRLSVHPTASGTQESDVHSLGEIANQWTQLGYVDDEGTNQTMPDAVYQGSKTSSDKVGAPADASFANGRDHVPEIPEVPAVPPTATVAVNESAERLDLSYHATTTLQAMLDAAEAADGVAGELRYGTLGSSVPRDPAGGYTVPLHHLGLTAVSSGPAEPVELAMVDVNCWDSSSSNGANNRENIHQTATVVGRGSAFRMRRIARSRYRVFDVPDGYVITSIIGEGGQTIDAWEHTTQGNNRERYVLGPVSADGRDAETFVVIVEEDS